MNDLTKKVTAGGLVAALGAAEAGAAPHDSDGHQPAATPADGHTHQEPEPPGRQGRRVMAVTSATAAHFDERGLALPLGLEVGKLPGGAKKQKTR
jgi:hypothetical protein